MRFFTNDRDDTRTPEPAERVQSEPVPVPQQRPESPWAQGPVPAAPPRHGQPDTGRRGEAPQPQADPRDRGQAEAGSRDEAEAQFPRLEALDRRTTPTADRTDTERADTERTDTERADTDRPDTDQAAGERIDRSEETTATRPTAADENTRADENGVALEEPVLGDRRDDGSATRPGWVDATREHRITDTARRPPEETAAETPGGDEAAARQPETDEAATRQPGAEDTAAERAAAERAAAERAAAETRGAEGVDGQHAAAEDRTEARSAEGAALDDGGTFEDPVVVEPGSDARAFSATNGELPGAVAAPTVGPLFADQDAHGFRDRWREVQLQFVDDPKAAAQAAVVLVDEAVEVLTVSLKTQRAALGDAASEGDTEQLRVRLRGYRDFLDRLLAL